MTILSRVGRAERQAATENRCDWSFGADLAAKIVQMKYGRGAPFASKKDLSKFKHL